MKYLSVCSGIEAATVAWHDLGWTPVGFSEIEPFPSAVLAHHYPEVPNLGDMTKYKEWPYERGSIDLLGGGTPCQAFSVAGLRKGLSDPRGNLALVYLGIADHFRPRWIVWENVPGVLSSNGGRDFGSFLGALAELGYGFAYRIIDAQFCGVPQRRRRVFVVGYLGDWRPAAAVLFERESLRGDSPPSREPGKIASALTANGVGTCGADDNQAQAGHLVAMTQYGEIAGSLTARHDSSPCADRGQNIVYGIPGNWIGRKPENGGNATEPMIDVSPCLTKTDRHAVAEYYENYGQDSRITGPHKTAETVAAKYGTGGGSTPIIMAHGQANAEIRADGQATTLTCNHEAPIIALSKRNFIGQDAVAGPLDAHYYKGPGSRNGGEREYVGDGSSVRRLTPIECERLQGFPDDWTRIPWRGKTAENCPDSPRYKAIGNSMAVPVMRWIGKRIQMVEQIIAKQSQEASA